LTNYVGSSAGTELKSTSGWNDNGNGTDNYGFSALPGGIGNSDGSFRDVGDTGYWWSATENYSSDAYCPNMGYNSSSVHRNGYSKSGLLSVRCVKDGP
jgi:uncharacterized protein (TIGR02145 family)